jgi:GTPase Era involved in 16S rRNA processing
MTHSNQEGTLFRVSVVGHTNAGKTSLMRTIARDAAFGAVSPSPGTTVEVASVKLFANGTPRADFRDTPGLEDPIGLLEFIDGLRTDRRDDGPSLIERFLGTEDSRNTFKNESKALRQARTADLVLYVVDARDRVLPRHSDEIELLNRCGKPVLPVLNFVSDDEARVDEWREALARLGLHATASFDTVVYESRDEQRLFEAMRVLAEDFRADIDALIKDRRTRRKKSIDRASRAIAELLVDAASYLQPVSPVSAEDDALRAERKRESEEALQAALREHERLTFHSILAAFEFKTEDAETALLECTDGRLGIDLFSRDAIRQAGFGAVAGAAGGAAGGAVIDLALGGMSLGAASALGALIGGTFGSSATQTKRLYRRMRGANDLRTGDLTLKLMMSRSIDLARAILRRGHADEKKVRPEEVTLDKAVLDQAIKALKSARSHPSWSGVGKSPPHGNDRERSIRRLTTLLRGQIVPDRSRQTKTS